MNPGEVNYVIMSEELDVTIYFGYDYYNDILRYYNVASQLHVHQAVKDHYTLTIL